MKIADFLNENETTISDGWLYERIRLWRDAQLALSDWTQVLDAQVDQAAWAAYRVLLRDLPASAATPQQLVFPVAP
ncbi:hypothetical protein E3T43_12815 [Cryobacterium sp. Hh7]|uniref:phage tail assembly chaperone n=1 Tax=Cryobacterium sp. Hh7 TaxID=1259159 RepID=UPI00106A6538|nr:phage tail assembly chaperone [Cryobacterium sp. Hh7]TFD54213.1 hypothetical protein E3T43_12815 [Cryobacterium sp. Hh7]